MTRLDAAPIERPYFEWLKDQVQVANKEQYEGLFQQMHEKGFVWIVPNDDNRLGDALELRREYAGRDYRRLQHGISFLEVVVGMSRRMAFIAEGDPKYWAWHLISNVELHKYRDPITRQKAERIDDIMETVIWRTYLHDGTGGFFPLAWPENDQTKVELWYQMNAYVNENFDSDA